MGKRFCLDYSGDDGEKKAKCAQLRSRHSIIRSMENEQRHVVEISKHMNNYICASVALHASACGVSVRCAFVHQEPCIFRCWIFIFIFIRLSRSRACVLAARCRCVREPFRVRTFEHNTSSLSLIFCVPLSTLLASIHTCAERYVPE